MVLGVIKVGVWDLSGRGGASQNIQALSCTLEDYTVEREKPEVDVVL